MTKQQLWQATLGELELVLSKANFTTWFKNTFVSDHQNDKVIVGVPNTFTKAWLEKKYHPSIIKALQKISEHRIKEVIYEVIATKVEESGPELNTKSYPAAAVVSIPAPVSSYSSSAPVVVNDLSLNQRYNFSGFVIGKGNELAHAASLAATKQPGQVYNPLFIYGGVGLGKTHLLQAIGNDILRRDPNQKVVYVSSEKFTNDFIRAISTNKTNQFKNTYRTANVLLIDDIQFIAGKDGTQEEFFHTFNALHQANRQIVLTSDRPPKAIPALEQRLVSRFEWGMIADINTPDLETRIAILDAKCKEKAFKLKVEIVSFLANAVQSNVRELEGALNKIIAHQQLRGTEPTLDETKKIVNSLTVNAPRRSVTPKQLINTVAEFYDLAIDDLMGSCRKKSFALPRQIIMYLMREELKSSYPSIGQEVGNRDHTTAMHAYVKITRVLDEDEKVNQDINLIKQRLYNA